MCPMARTALKHKHMASKFNRGVKMMKKSTAQWLPSQKAICRAFLFNYCALIFWLCKNYQMCTIIENRTVHDLFNYCTLVLCICIWKKLEQIFKNHFKQPVLIYSTLISKMKLKFYKILIVSYKSIIDLAGALYLPQNR